MINNSNYWKARSMFIIMNIKNIINSIKKAINNILDQIEENFGPKLQPVNIKSKKDKKRG